MHYSTVLFDFDGTLTNSLELWLQSFHYAFAQFDKKHSDDVVIKQCFYRSLRDVSADFLVPEEEFRVHLQTGLWNAFENPDLFEGVLETLESIKKIGAKIGLVTSSSADVVHRALSGMKIDSFFSAVVTANDIINFKPHPEPVLLAMRRLDSVPARTIFVGDSEADILAGHAAGTDTALFFPAVHHRFYEFDKLNATKPHFVFGDYADLGKHLFASRNQTGAMR
ncbi:MAG TPA: HAD family hydrolase [Oculatellaceae cyanobacterium]